MRVGRNDPCYCGSGKKYKKCHLPREEFEKKVSDPAVIADINAQIASNFEVDRQRRAYGYHLPHIECEFHGKRVRGVASTVYMRPPEETFHEFMIMILMQTLGERWFNEQRKLPPSERHFIMRCWDKFNEWKVRTRPTATREGSSWGAVPDGWTRSLIALAIDIYSLAHRGELPALLLKRLRHPDQYQGARYEIAIAGMFVRLGCEVKSLDRSTSDAVGRHCEFVATHQETGVAVIVEAKSRHRPGVLGRRGQAPDLAQIRGDIDHLIADALSKPIGESAFMVFVDVNAPMDVNVNPSERPWVEDVESHLRSLSGGSVDAPAKWNVMAITNYSYHYATENEAMGGQYVARAAEFPGHPLPSPEFMRYLRDGLNHYGEVPPLA